MRFTNRILFILITLCLGINAVAQRQPSSTVKTSKPVIVGDRKPQLAATNFVVNDTGDAADNSPGDNNCSTSGGVCTLRAAIQEANALTGTQTITFSVAGVIALASPLPDLSTDLNISGPGTNVLTVQPADAFGFRIFNVPSGATVGIAALTIANGRAPDGTGNGTSNGTPGGDGGGIKNSGTLTLDAVTVTGSSAGEGGCSCAQLILGGPGGHGGGIFNNGTLTITNSTIKDNRAGTGGSGNLLTSGGGQGGFGGGIYNTGAMSITSSTISGNRSGTAGGFGGKAGLGAGIYAAGSSNVITSSTISTNSVGACPNPDIIFNGNPTSCGGQVAFGGGIHATSSTVVTSSTIAFNNAVEGGGVYALGTLTLRNSIIARNTAGNGPDIRNTINSEGYNFIQNPTGGTINEVLNSSTNITNLDPHLGPLAPTGGPTETHALRFDSPALDKGKNFGITTDQRGLSRTFDNPIWPNAANGDGTDIGAWEAQSIIFDFTSPTVVSILRASPNPTTPNTSVNVTVTFSEPVVGVDATDLLLNISGASSGASITNISGTGATRTVTVDTGNLGIAGNGTGAIRLDLVDDDSITDFSGNLLGGAGAGNGDFNTGESYTVTYPTLVVTQTADSNDGVCDANCSLRDAVDVANAMAGAQVINFQIPGNDPGCSSAACTINLQAASGQDANSGLTISGDTIINGPGAKVFKLQPASGQRFRVLRVSTGATVVISGLTVTGGLPVNAPHCTSGDKHGINGGGLVNLGALTLSDMIVSNNRAGNGGTCNNDQGGEGGAGGGIFNVAGATLIVVRSTISDNFSGDGGNNIASSGPLGGVGGSGGGINNDGTLTIIDSTISGNRSGTGGQRNFGGSGSAGGDGGGIFNFTGATATLINSTISGNESGPGGACASSGQGGNGGNGGGLHNRPGATITISNSTVSFNKAGGSSGFQCVGGLIGSGGGLDSQNTSTTTIRSSIFSNNVAPTGADARGNVRSHGYSLIQSPFNFTLIEDQNAGTNLINVDPLLAPLADNGGPTKTHALGVNSPAVDKGRNFATDVAGNPLPKDQRGQQRPNDLGIPNAGGGDGSDIGAFELIIPPIVAGQLIISEFRTNGPGGPTDDFVEIYNTTNADINVLATDGSAGFLVFTTGSRSCLIPNGTIIKARGHFLCAGAGYSLVAAAQPDAVFNFDVLDNAAIGLFSRSQQLTTADALDRVAPAGTTIGGEGTPLPTFTSAPTTDHAWLRDLTTGVPRDTNNNAADFRLVSPGGGVVGGVQSTLGAAGPEGSASHKDVTSMFGVFFLDQTVAPTVAPNRVRDLTPNPVNVSTFGTMSLRRRFVNNTGGPVTRLRFRIINITGFPVTDSLLADLRVLTSVDAVISGINDSSTCSPNPAPCSVTVRGLTVEPLQASGGGLNSTLSAGSISVGTPLANGESISVEFRLGVQKTGNFRFYVNVEALP
jgi:CSLREA domain-containing protein